MMIAHNMPTQSVTKNDYSLLLHTHQETCRLHIWLQTGMHTPLIHIQL